LLGTDSRVFARNTHYVTMMARAKFLLQCSDVNVNENVNVNRRVTCCADYAAGSAGPLSEEEAIRLIQELRQAADIGVEFGQAASETGKVKRLLQDVPTVDDLEVSRELSRFAHLSPLEYS
jgi:coenzyme F420-reducing hydrogenase gamma subunit